MSFKTIFIIFMSITALVVVVGGGYLWYQAKVSTGLFLEVGLPEEINVGTPFEMEVKINNDSRNILGDADLIVELPEDVVFLGDSPEKSFKTVELGDLGIGSLTTEKLQLLALGGDSTVKEITVTVSYLPTSLSSKFEKTEKVNFSIVGSSIKIDLSLPQKVFSGEEFEMVVSYSNSSDQDFSDLKIRVSYPPAFVFKSASLTPDASNNVWDLASLKKGDSGNFTIRGVMSGPDEAFFEFNAMLETNILGRNYSIAKKSASIAIAPSPLSLSVFLDKGSEYLAKRGDDLRYTLAFKNNTDIGLRDVVVRAKFTGEMFDFSKLSTNASFQTLTRTLSWNTSNAQVLNIISPGGTGSVEFSIKLKDEYPISRLSDKDFTIRVDAEIESPTVPLFVSANKTVGLASIENKVSGEVQVDAQAFFRDASSGILNKGPWPMKVGQPTNFTIHWVLKNFSTDVKDVKIKAFLGANVRLTDEIKSNFATKPVYNERTQEVVWLLDRISAGRGVVNQPLEAIFQIEATPSLNQLNLPMVLIQQTSVEAMDEFTGGFLSGSDREISSSSLDDPTVSQDEGTVRQ